ncbi:hypothetical protein [Neomesorhizobium albiziae]|uniref:hypothetical protein n=1 Tax=Neomesorhizobium albiziae TaxID=335020 RepID=UPI00165F9723|nr:hypothetical protein [Mesorhizobium albiziae]GLS29196.1 hypothetical protein GCM10007937_09030 [Mesorhizobium albiziae]
MVGRSRGEVYACGPGPVQRVGRRVDHTGGAVSFSSSPIGVAGRTAWIAARRLSSSMGEAAGEPDGRLLEGHDLEAMTSVAGSQAAFPHGEATQCDLTSTIVVQNHVGYFCRRPA